MRVVEMRCRERRVHKANREARALIRSNRHAIISGGAPGIETSGSGASG
jgi:hypothetical protein